MSPELLAADLAGVVLLAASASAILSRRRRPVAPPLPALAAAQVFRRPAEMGPLYQSWDQVERIRVEILTDQLAGPVDDWVCVHLEGGPVPIDGALEELEEPRERALYWLAHWQDHVLALTGRGLPA